MSLSKSINARLSPQVISHLGFIIACTLAFIILFAVLRLALMLFNQGLMGTIPLASFIEAFVNGVRFDLRVVAFILLPLILAIVSMRAMHARSLMRYWLTACASIAALLGIIELNFYQEFHQRLNGLVFQYFQEDPATVLSMLWYGFPVLRLLGAWTAVSLLLFGLFRLLERLTFKAPDSTLTPPILLRTTTLLVCLLILVAVGRGTLRQGAPLRWGDAYTTEFMFTNHLGLNPALTLFDAARHRFSDHRDNAWTAVMPAEEALTITRDLLLSSNEQLVDSELAPVRRDYLPDPDNTLPIRNVVLILMESFAGRYVGALGSQDKITPEFDRLAEQGLLFTRFFGNGTHTHQGMFASMACFPNLPGFEYLMQSPEGAQRFSGLPQLLGNRDFNDVYVYNGDFAWDNQMGFFGNQGMTRFVGRNDYVDPVVSDPTWGVSDQDMFDRAITELGQLGNTTPWYALLQTLSNHTPYALPEQLPVEPVTGQGSLDEHLTAMRYADWALGRFFEQARTLPSYDETLFVIVGDHGFGAPEQLTEIDLLRFHVPLLLIAPGVTEKFGHRRDLVGTQVDLVPTIMGRLGGEVRHQCWGRDLLNLADNDTGFGIIKPSGSDQTVAILKDDSILIQPVGFEPVLYQYTLGSNPGTTRLEMGAAHETMLAQLYAYLQVATAGLLSQSVGDRAETPISTTDAGEPKPPIALLR